MKDIGTIRNETLFKYPSDQYLGVLNSNLSHKFGDINSYQGILHNSEDNISYGNMLMITGEALSLIFGISVGSIIIEEIIRRNQKTNG
jgi:hypothetical protein